MEFASILNRKRVSRILSLALLSLIHFTASSQEKATQADTSTLLSNNMFILLLTMIILLLIVIFVFAEVLKAAAQHKIDRDKKEGPGAGSIIKTFLFLFSLGGLSQNAFAQEAASVAQAQSSYWGLDSFTFYSMITIIGIEIFIVYMLYSFFMQLLGVEEREGKLAEEKEKLTAKQPSFIERFNASVAVEEEAEIMLDHNYDGIRELDNDLPPWWKYGFAFTIVFAIVYLIHYQVLHTGQSPNEEYEEQLSTAKAEMEEYRKKAANLVDENNATLLTDKGSLQSGRSIYIENCAPCHGKSGEGNVGPNLTDDYWLHGGSVKDIFKIVKYGWPEKGMKSWQQDLGAKQIHEVASFILSLHGTNPANAKEQQGELYQQIIENDSTKAIINDSLRIAQKK